MAFIAPLLPIISTVLGAGAAVVSGISSIQQGNYQNAVAKQNALAAEAYAAAESEAAQREGMRSDREYAALEAEQLAAQGASGLDVLGRTQIKTRMLSRQVGREARTDIRQKGTYASRKLQQDAANFRAEGSAAQKQGLASGFGSFLKAGSQVAGAFNVPKSLATKRTRRTTKYPGGG